MDLMSLTLMEMYMQISSSAPLSSLSVLFALNLIDKLTNCTLHMSKKMIPFKSAFSSKKKARNWTEIFQSGKMAFVIVVLCLDWCQI